MATLKKTIKKASNTTSATSKKKVIAKKTVSSKPKVQPKKEEVNLAIFPIGKFMYDEKIASKKINEYIDAIADLPKQFKKLTKKIKKEDLQKSYREGGWTIEQIIHHTADSHMNAFIRFKLTLTETSPIIKPYIQDLFAETPDVFDTDIKSSVRIIRGVHERWTKLLQNMTATDFKKVYVHPEYKTEYSLLHALSLYAWHGKHHVEQIKVALKSNN